jgi:RNA polymerase sigma factor (sigma-70 family)
LPCPPRDVDLIDSSAAVVTAFGAGGTLLVMGDAEAFSVLYEREGEAVFSFLARRTMDAEVAVDLTAETFAIALRSWAKLRPLVAEQRRAWLFTVARRLHGRYVRRARVERRALERLGIQVPSIGADDLALIDERCGLGELRAALGLELERLSVTQRDALRLRVVEERPYTEVARCLGVTEETARTRVSRGLRALTAALEPRFGLGEGAP